MGDPPNQKGKIHQIFREWTPLELKKGQNFIEAGQDNKDHKPEADRIVRNDLRNSRDCNIQQNKGRFGENDREKGDEVELDKLDSENINRTTNSKVKCR